MYQLCNICFMFAFQVLHEKAKRKSKVKQNGGERQREKECCQGKLVKKFLKLNYVGSRGLYHFDML